MRRLLKFLHTLGAIGLMGAVASLLVLLGVAASPTTSPEGYALLRGAMGIIATWVFLPGLALTLVAGLLAMAVNSAYLNAGWAWIKLATGVLIFEGFVRVQGTMQAAADPAAAPAGPPAARALWAEQATLWLLLAVAGANVALAIWRPRLARRRG